MMWVASWWKFSSVWEVEGLRQVCKLILCALCFPLKMNASFRLCRLWGRKLPVGYRRVWGAPLWKRWPMFSAFRHWELWDGAWVHSVSFQIWGCSWLHLQVSARIHWWVSFFYLFFLLVCVIKNKRTESFSLRVLPLLTGHNCSVDVNECESSPCQNEGNCQDLINSYQCECLDGFTGGRVIVF